MALQQLYVDPSIAGNSGTGTIGDPYGDLEYCFATAHHDATYGSQINIKAGTAEVLSASLAPVTHFGTPTYGAQMLLRGYTSVANDGGQAEINCNGHTFITPYTLDYIGVQDLQIHTMGDNQGIDLDTYCTVRHCHVHKGASSPGSMKAAVRLGAGGIVERCYIPAYGGSVYGEILFLSLGKALFNYIITNTIGIYTAGANGSIEVRGNIIRCSSVGAVGIGNTSIADNYDGNIIYGYTGGTGKGIWFSASTRPGNIARNNIICGFSGTGGTGIYATGEVSSAGYNAFYNNTANYNLSGRVILDDLRAQDVVLAADPFVDAANGDFSLTAAAKAALAAKGWPLAYLGAHANTVPNLNIGPIQMAAGSGSSGAVSISPWRGGMIG